MLDKMGFDNHTFHLFMSCISSVNYKISHASKSFSSISPERGLRQGDPLSSYLFLMCIEGLTGLTNDFEKRKLITGIKLARSAPPISHMFLSDDSYIFCKYSTDSAVNFLHLLNIFERASGQQINVDKSQVFFSKNTSLSLKNELCQ